MKTQQKRRAPGDTRRMKLLGPLLLAVTLAGCASSPAPQVTVTAPRATVTVTQSAPIPTTIPTPGRADREDFFVGYVRREISGPTIEKTADEELVRWGRAVCADLDAGRTFTAASLRVYGKGDMTINQAGGFSGASVAAFCPEHKDDVK